MNDRYRYPSKDKFSQRTSTLSLFQITEENDHVGRVFDKKKRFHGLK